MSGKKRKTYLPLWLDFIWNMPDYVSRFANRHPRFKGLIWTGFVAAIVLVLLILVTFSTVVDAAGGSLAAMGAGFSNIGGISSSTLAIGLVLTGIIGIILFIASPARRRARAEEEAAKDDEVDK